MNSRLKKALIISASTIIPLGILGAGAAIYFTTPTPQRISTKGIFSVRVNEALNDYGYKYDLSASYGSATSSNYYSLLVTNEILHLQTSGELQYKQAVLDNDGNILESAKVIKPSYESYKFANANAIVLTFIKSDITEDQITSDFFTNPANSDKYFQLVFDSDADEITPAPSSDEQIVVTKSSKDPKSINNHDVFGHIINKGYLNSKPDLSSENVTIEDGKQYVMYGMGITFNRGAKWVDSNGKETKYDICARDMFYSSKRTWLYDRTYRRAHGGTKELDQYFISKTQTTKMFAETQKYPNDYLFDFFGINKEKLYDEAYAIQKVNSNSINETDAFTFTFDIFNSDKTIKNDFSFSTSDIIKKYLVNSIHFSLAPSQYIDEVVNTAKNNKTAVGTIEDEAAKYGIYTYAQSRKSTLFASAYIPTSSESNREIYEYNKHFANKDWVKSVEEGEVSSDGTKYKNLNKIIYEYSGGIDSSTFINKSFSSFMNGTLSKVDYSLLSDAQKQKLYGSGNSTATLLENAEKNGLKVTKNVNISQLNTRMVWQANPIENSDYNFNDNYSKLVYGYSKNDLSSGKAVTSNSFYASYGLKFRLLIQASINWQQYIQQAYSGTRDVWLSGAAQNAVFSGNREDSLTPIDFNEKGINDLVYFDKDNKKQVVTLLEMKKLSNSSAEELGPDASQDLQLTKMRSPQFKIIQESMKNLLDQFYKDNNLSSNEKISWDITYPFADQDEIKCEATKYIVENVINGLDPRLEAKFVKPTSREEMLSYINQRKSAYNANLWSYDYEGIGSYIAAFSSDGGGINIMNAYGIFSKDVDGDSDELFNSVERDGIKISRPSRETVSLVQQMFPRFTELSKYIREKMNALLTEGGVSVSEELKVENWDLISNSQNNHIISFFTEQEGIENPNKVNPISNLPIFYKSFETDAPWANLDKNEAGQAWTDLIKELDSIKGVSIDTESSVDRLENINYVLYLNEYTVPVSKYGIQMYCDFKYKVDK